MRETRFKDTEIGRIPGNWESVSLGNIGEVKMCKRVMKYQTSDRGDIPFYKIGTFGKQPDAFITRSLFELYRNKYNYPKQGDILLSAAGTIGRTVVFDGQPSYFQDSNIVWIANDEKILSNALLYYIYKQLSWVTESGTIPRIYNGIVRSIKFAIPTSQEEQRNIASALTSIYNLISSLDKLIEKKKNIKQGTMQQLLTGKKRLKGFSEPWVEKKLGNCCTIKARIGWQGLKSDEYLDYGEYFLVTSTDIIDKRINWDTCHFVSKERYIQDTNIQIRKHDVLVSKDGTIGKVAFIDEVPGEGTLNSGVFVIRSKDERLSQEYLAWIFMSMYFDDFINKIVAGSTIVHLYQKDIVNFSFMIPPTKEEQAAIASILTTMDNDISSLEKKKAKYESMKQGMMQQLLTGRIRLI